MEMKLKKRNIVDVSKAKDVIEDSSTVVSEKCFHCLKLLKERDCFRSWITPTGTCIKLCEPCDEFCNHILTDAGMQERGWERWPLRQYIK
jgi:hypothetical protein